MTLPQLRRRLPYLSRLYRQRDAARNEVEGLRKEAERLKAEARQREEVRAQYQAALDAQAYRNLAEREIARAWDPQGLWGPMTLASKLD